MKRLLALSLTSRNPSIEGFLFSLIKVQDTEYSWIRLRAGLYIAKSMKQDSAHISKYGGALGIRDSGLPRPYETYLSLTKESP